MGNTQRVREALENLNAEGAIPDRRPQLMLEAGLRGLPPIECDPNAGYHSRVEGAERRKWCEILVADMTTAWRAELIRSAPWPRVRVEVTAFVWQAAPRGLLDRYRPRDVPNLVTALKGFYDALTAESWWKNGKHAGQLRQPGIGLVKDDTAAHLVLGDHDIQPAASAAQERLGVRVWRLPAREARGDD